MDLLAKHGIELRNRNPGNHKARCPQCSHTRRNKADPCLSVLIEQDGTLRWNCHHCGWKGADDGREPDERPAPHRRSRHAERAERGRKWRSEFRQGRW